MLFLCFIRLRPAVCMSNMPMVCMQFYFLCISSSSFSSSSSPIQLPGINASHIRRMSKSLGNVVDPLAVIKECGTDALRFTVATGSAVGQVGSGVGLGVGQATYMSVPVLTSCCFTYAVF